MKFLIGEIIRNKRTTKPYLVVNVIYSVVFVTDLEQKINPTPILAILNRDIKNYIKDTETDCITKREYTRLDEEQITNEFRESERVSMT